MSSPTRVMFGVGGAIFAASSALAIPGYRGDYQHEAQTDSANAATATAFLESYNQVATEIDDLVVQSNNRLSDLYVQAGPACLLEIKPWIGDANSLPEGVTCDLDESQLTTLRHQVVGEEATNRDLRSYIEADVYSWLPSPRLEMAADSAFAVVADARNHSFGEELFDLDTYDVVDPVYVTGDSVEPVSYTHL
ncbi:MAG: hypothetical protein KIH63_002185, partial [Candidatus Saccharibacteria bacterium]|nr:hypothetical protein [Candidatus Saccharibacteria bacterium]